jgi:hypothetical protein
MNCRPGDLAYIVNAAMPENIGRMVQVLEPLGVEPFWGGFRWRIGPCKGQFCWLVRSCGVPLLAVKGGQFVEIPVADSQLRPIRDPGDDAQDESLLWAPAPEKATV